MPITTSIFDPRTMGRVIERMPKVRTFFRDTFFKTPVTFPTESVDFDMKKGNRALAPFVHPRVGSKTILNTGFSTRSYKAPLLAPDKVTTVEDLINRMAGENPYSGRTPAERAVEKLAEDFRELDEMIARREEWMCAQAIITGKIPIVGDGLNEEIDFSFSNTETLAAARKWSAAGSNPIDDLKRWRKQVQKEGYVNCDICIMADDVVSAFVNNENVKSLLDTKRYDLAAIAPRELPNGCTYVGTINGLGLDIYTYTEWYLDDWSGVPEEKPLIPNGKVVLISTAAEYSILYGAVTFIDKTEEFRTVMGDRVPNTYVARRPDRRFLQLNSRPLPVPHEVNSWFVATVL